MFFQKTNLQRGGGRGEKLIFPSCRVLRRLFPGINSDYNINDDSNGAAALATATHAYSDFLAITANSWKLCRHKSTQYDRFAERYVAFLELQKQFPSAVPTRDISIAWCCDLLDRPHQEHNKVTTTAKNNNDNDDDKEELQPKQPHDVDIDELQLNQQWYFHQQRRIIQAGTFRPTSPPTSHFLENLSMVMVVGGMAGWIGSYLILPAALPTKTTIVEGFQYLLGGGCGLSIYITPSGKEKIAAISTTSIKPLLNNKEYFTAADRERVLQHWKENYSTTAWVWKSWTDTKYRIGDTAHKPFEIRPLTSLPILNVVGERIPDKLKRTVDPLSSNTTELRNRIAQSIQSQASFVSKVVDGEQLFGKLYEGNYKGKLIRYAVMRYILFLNLAAAKKDDEYDNFLLVPTMDIDLVWHAHMLSPVDYDRDTLAICGKALSHRQGGSDMSQLHHATKEQLEEGRIRTKQLWDMTYPGVAYGMIEGLQYMNAIDEELLMPNSEEGDDQQEQSQSSVNSWEPEEEDDMPTLGSALEKEIKDRLTGKTWAEEYLQDCLKSALKSSRLPPGNDINGAIIDETMGEANDYNVSLSGNEAWDDASCSSGGDGGDCGGGCGGD